MTPSQLALLRQSAVTVASDAERASHLFYERLFEIDPGLRSLFKSPQGVPGKRLMQVIDTAVFCVDKPALLNPMLKALGQRHATYGVKVDDYASVATALLWTLDQMLGAAYTDEVRQAWETFYTETTELMLAGAAEPATPRWE